MAKRNALKSHSTDSVGYGKPPKASQFKKGMSGNPKGRPPGALNFATVLQRALREKVTVTENGRRRVITKLVAAVKQLVNKAASGDQRALQQLLGLLSASDEQPAPVSVQPRKPGMDQEIVQSILRRMQRGLMEQSR
jgi:hypothetical protein